MIVRKQNWTLCYYFTHWNQHFILLMRYMQHVYIFTKDTAKTMLHLLHPCLTQNLPVLHKGLRAQLEHFTQLPSCCLALRKKQNQEYFRDRTADCCYLLQLHPYKAEEGGNFDSWNLILEETQPVISCITAPHRDQEQVTMTGSITVIKDRSFKAESKNKIKYVVLPHL